MEAIAHDDCVAIDGETMCEVRVYNQGETAAGGVRVRMTIPANMVATKVSAPQHWQAQGQEILFDPVDEMPPRHAAVYRIQLRGAHGGIAPLRIALTADGLAQAIQQEMTCRVQEKTVRGGP